ncbi:MAG: hypothetical protein AB7O97_03070 [Planctomycetota bacterium]
MDWLTGGLLVPVTLLAVETAAAQQTWIVDRMNRPGTDFTDLPAAVAAAAPRDILHLRATSSPLDYYSAPAAIDGKPLTIRGEGPATRLAGRFEVRNVAFGESFVFADLSFEGRSDTNWVGFGFTSNAGTIVLSDVRVAGLLDISLLGPINRWVDCALVVVTGCQIDVADAPWRVERTRLAVANSDFEHSSPNLISSLYWPGVLDLQDSTLWSTNSEFRGPSTSLTTPPLSFAASPPLYLCRSTVYLGPGTAVVGGVDGAGSRRPGFSNACFGDPDLPEVYLDGSVQTIGGLGSSIVYHHTDLSGLSHTLTPTTLQLDHLYGPPGASLLVLGPLTSTPWSGAGVGPVFVDLPSAWSDLRLALVPGPSTRTFAVPPGIPPGTVLGAQALTLIPPATLLTSNVTAIVFP